MKKYDIIQFSDVSPASTIERVEVTMKKNQMQIRRDKVNYKYQKPQIQKFEEEFKPKVKKHVSLKNNMKVKAL